MTNTDSKLETHPAPAGSPVGLVRVVAPWSGEMLRGMRVAEWRWRDQNNHWDHATHWSTGPQDRQERLYTEADMLAVLASRDAAFAALVSLEAESVFEESGCEVESFLEAKNNALAVLKAARESSLGAPDADDELPQVVQAPKAPAPATTKAARRGQSVGYEWDVEIVADGDTVEHEDGEVLEHDHCGSYAEAKRKAAETPPEGCRYVIVLVRDDDKCRAWAYLEDGKLPETFTDGLGHEYRQVPKRFVDEVAKG